MNKIVIKKELVCPLKKCKISYVHENEKNLVVVDKYDHKEIHDKFGNEMSTACDHCEYVWNGESVVVEKSELDENSEECKEYVFFHTVKCVNDENK